MPTLFVEMLLDPPDEVSDLVLPPRPSSFTQGGKPCPDIIDQATDDGHHPPDAEPTVSSSMTSAAAPAG